MIMMNAYISHAQISVIINCLDCGCARFCGVCHSGWDAACCVACCCDGGRGNGKEETLN